MAIALCQAFTLTMNMDHSLFQTLFGCAHRRTTFPLTPIRRGRIAAQPNGESKGPNLHCLPRLREGIAVRLEQDATD
jgi:hypothetical protein